MRMHEIAQRPARSGLRLARRRLAEGGELPRELVGPELDFTRAHGRERL